MIEDRTITASELEDLAAKLNARSWDEVREGIPEWHPRNDGGDEGGEGGGEAEAGGGEGGGTATAEAGAGGEDRLLDALNTFGSQFTQRLDALDQRLPAPQEQTPAADGGDETELESIIESITDELDDEFFDEQDNLTPEGHAALMYQLAQQAVQAELEPQRQQEAQDQRDAAADALEEKYPELQDEKVQEQMLGRLKQFCQKIGRPELAVEPAMLEQVYLAAKAEERAAAETPASGSPTLPLERTSAAAGAEQKQEDEGDRIVNLATKQKFRL